MDGGDTVGAHEDGARGSSLGGLELLRRILDERGVEYFIDSGVLLGLRRDGGLNPWEKDLDLAVTTSALPALLDAVDALEDAGFATLVNRYRGRVFAVGITPPGGVGPEALRAAVHVYYEDGGSLWSPQPQIYVPPPAPDLYHGERSQAGEALRAMVERRFYRPDADAGRVSRAPEGTSVPYRVARWLYRRIDRGWLAETWPIREVFVPMTWVIPRELVLPLSELDVGGERYRVPGRVDEYLDYRYGDWRTPVQDWCYWEDDGAIRHRRPTEVARELGAVRP